VSSFIEASLFVVGSNSQGLFFAAPTVGIVQIGNNGALGSGLLTSLR
jgi:hypothetical protein